jgi:hypothetical protein
MMSDEQTELEAEHNANEADKAIAEILYRKAFAGPSLGTEEELTGATIRMRYTDNRLIGVVFKGADPLVLITRDMQIQKLAGAYREYTIELRTTPTELPAQANQPGAEWESRRRALQVAIWAIDAKTEFPLADDEWGGFTTKIRNDGHKFFKQSAYITGSGKQSTFGIPAAEIVAASQQNRATGQLHPHVKVGWYQDQFTADPAAAQLSTPEKVAYAFLKSAAAKLVSLPRDKGETYLFRSDVKNAWNVRPRTPPVKILAAFLADRKQAVLQAFAASTAPSSVSAEDWAKYTGWITDGRPLGGHALPDTTVSGVPAMLFEYRTAAPERYPYAFWNFDEWTTADF